MGKARCPICKQSIKVEQGVLILHHISKRVGKSVSHTPCGGGGLAPR